jgi:hypothetical protein
LVTDEVVKSIFEFTEGHAYVMRLLVGEMAKEKRYVAPKSLLPRRFDIVQAVFERSFNKLSDPGRWVFLIAANWRSAVPELAVLVIGGQRELDVENGIEECLRLSLLEMHYMRDGQPCLSAPELARIFGRKKLDSDPDRLAIQEDLQTIKRFGVLPLRDTRRFGQNDLVEEFLRGAMKEAEGKDAGEISRLGDLLASVAELYPPAWGAVARFRVRFGPDPESVEQALRRYVEERPSEKEAWVLRAEYAKQVGDDQTMIASLVSAVDAAPADVDLVREAAYQICRFIDARKGEIPRTRRVYVAGVRNYITACRYAGCHGP